MLLIGVHSHPSDRNWFNGIIDEVSVYNYAKTAEEIWEDYQSFITPEPPCNCTELTERVSTLEEETEDLQSRVETLEQGQGTVPPHNHTISEVIGLQGALDTIQELICKIIYDLLPKGLLQAAKFDTTYCQ